jgi:hypothetical protein
VFPSGGKIFFRKEVSPALLIIKRNRAFTALCVSARPPEQKNDQAIAKDM